MPSSTPARVVTLGGTWAGQSLGIVPRMGRRQLGRRAVEAPYASPCGPRVSARPAGGGEGGQAASLQALLEADRSCAPPGPEGARRGPSIADPVGLFRYLESTRRFHRDSGFGRIFHRGRVSFRENLPTDSLHVLIDGNHLAAHVDRVSPLGLRPERPPRYSLRRTAAHNLVGAAHDFIRLLRGRQGDHRSELDCEWLWDPSQRFPRSGVLLDGRASAWSVQMEAQVSGHLDEGRLREALTAVLSRRPPDHDPLWVVDCADEASLDEARGRLQSRPAGTTEWPPLRVALARRAEGDVLMLNVNHAASDGFDALRLLRTIASAYATGTRPEPAPDFMALAELPVRPAPALVSGVTAHYRSAVERLRDLLARPALLAPDGAGHDAAFGFHLSCLTVEETSRVVDVRRPGTSRNVILAGLHLAIGEWNLRHGTPGRRVGVLVPVNLRAPEWPEEVVGNFSVTARVSTSRRHRSGGTAALEAVTAQTTRNKQSRTGVALLSALERSGLLPLWCKQSLVVLQPLVRNRLVDTALLANLDSLEEAPSFGEAAGETVHLWYSVPARGPLTLCVGAVTVGGRLHLVLRYPRRLFSASAARRFSDCFVSEIMGVAAGRP